MVSQWEKQISFPQKQKEKFQHSSGEILIKSTFFCRVDERLNTVFLSKHQVDRFETGHRE
ncbi:MAG: hypothetical protein WAU61_14705 [Smithella sp.]